MYHLLSCIYTAVRRICAPGRFSSAWRRLAAALTEHRRRAAARSELSSLDERTLRDIGLSHRAAAEWPRSREL